MDAAIQAELAELRRRAFGLHPDIDGDPAAMARLIELEQLVLVEHAASVAAAGLRNVTGWPSNLKVPESGWTTPAITIISVDFPAPFSPRTAWVSPRTHSNRASSSARTPP